MTGEVIVLRPELATVEQMLSGIAAGFPQAEGVIVAVFDRGVMSLHARGAKAEWFALAGAAFLKRAVTDPFAPPEGM